MLGRRRVLEGPDQLDGGQMVQKRRGTHVTQDAVHEQGHLGSGVDHQSRLDLGHVR